MLIDVDLGGHTAEELEGSAQLPAGWYLARVCDVHSDQKTGALKVVWEMQSAPWVGARLTDTYNLPALAMTTEALPGLIRRLGLFLYRMGLVAKEDMGKRLNLDCAKLIGVQRVLELKREPSKDPAKQGKEYTNVAYGGYWALDRPEIPPAERVRLGLPLLPGQTAPASSPPNGQQQHSLPAAGKSLPGGGPPAVAFDPAEV